MRIEWNSYFMIMAKMASLRSSCNSRPSGAVIVNSENRILSTGFTGTVPGREQCSDKGSDFCYRRSVGGPEDDKYNICPSIHAEQNAIIQAAKSGISIDGTVMYCTLSPCYVCLKMIAGAGIYKVYYELSYESKDHDRDALWRNTKKVGVVSEQLLLSDEEVEIARQKMLGFTSQRRMKSE